MQAYKNSQKENDARRGIQNTEVRFQEKIKERLLSEQLQNPPLRARSDKESDSNEDDFEDARILQESFDTMRNSMHQNAVRHNSLKNISLKKGLRTSKSGASFGGLGTLLWITFFQFFFAISSAFFFATYALTEGYVESSTLGGVVSIFNSLIESLVGVDLLAVVSGLWFAWCFWGLIAFITFLILFIAIPWFVIQKIPVFSGSTTVLAFGLCVGANLTPFLNIIPWIELWAGFWLLQGPLQTMKSLSNGSKPK